MVLSRPELGKLEHTIVISVQNHAVKHIFYVPDHSTALTSKVVKQKHKINPQKRFDKVVCFLRPDCPRALRPYCPRALRPDCPRALRPDCPPKSDKVLFWIFFSQVWCNQVCSQVWCSQAWCSQVWFKINQLTSITINTEALWFEGTDECMSPLPTFLAKQMELQTLTMKSNSLSDAQKDQIRQAVTDSAPNCEIEDLDWAMS